MNKKPRLRALCVGRHRFLSDHFARFFAALDVETREAVGLEEALVVSRTFRPEVVICEYEVLATLSLAGMRARFVKSSRSKRGNGMSFSRACR